VGAALAARLARETAGLAARGRLRARAARTAAGAARITIGGREYVNFTSNDYLGLASDPRILERVAAELPRHGFGSGSAALLGGRSSLHAELERTLAEFVGVDGALLFSSGYLANLGALGALLRREDLVVHDKLNHASLIDAVLATGATHRRYAHGDAGAAAARLGEPCAAARWCVTESLFSMDGDCAPLAALADTAFAHDAELYVDDAHGFGVLADGRGAAALLSAEQRRRTLFMVTCGKSLGSVGAAVLGPGEVIEYLVQRARTYIYDTALPPVCAAAALEALALLRAEPVLPRRLAANITRFRAAAGRLDLAPGAAMSPIQPIVLGEDRRAVAVAEALLAAGYYVRAIRPPTVPEGSARLRITLTAAHSDADIDGLAEALGACLASRGTMP